MSTTVNYKGNTIATVNNETKTLNTAGTWVEGDITVVDAVDGRYTAAISVTSAIMVGENRTRVEYNGQKYYTDGRMFSFDAGDTLTIYAWPTPSAQPQASISIDGTVVRSSTSGYSVQYTYTLPTHNINIELVSTAVRVTSTLQSKTVSYTPSETAQTATVTADSGYDGLGSVDISVGAIPGTYVGSQVPTQAAQTIHPSTSAQTIASGKYLTGDQTIEAVTTTNLTAANIKSGVVVKVGSATDDDSVLSLTGTAETGGATLEDEANATGTTAVITGTESSGGGISVDDIATNTQPSGAITLGSGVTTIGQYAFAGKSVTTVNAKFVKTIGSYAFIRSDLRYVTDEYFPALTTLGADALDSALALIKVHITGAYSYFSQLYTMRNNTTGTFKVARFPNCTGNGNQYTFGGDYGLKIVDAGKISSIGPNFAGNARVLQTLILRKTDSVCTLSNVSAFTNTPFRGYNSLSGVVYVPSALISSYESATNWSTLVTGGYLSFAPLEGSAYENIDWDDSSFLS